MTATLVFLLIGLGIATFALISNKKFGLILFTVFVLYFIWIMYIIGWT